MYYLDCLITLSPQSDIVGVVPLIWMASWLKIGTLTNMKTALIKILVTNPEHTKILEY